MVIKVLSLRNLFAFFVGCLFLAGCSVKEHDSIVATIGGTPLTLKEYETIYAKSNGTRDSGATASQQEREKFLDLIVKYKLKLKDAYAQGLDRTREATQEIEQYKGNLAQSFLTEREVVSPGVHQLYKRRTEELRVSHILFTLSPTASPDDSAAAYTKAYQVLAELDSGKDFGTLAAALSKDPSARDTKGDLYYVTGGDLVAPFEDAAYSLKPGQVYPAPVRTRFGLHLIKLVDRRPAPGEVRASHIMIRFSSMVPAPEETTKAYAKIRKIQDSLALGFDFAELAKRNSEDGGSASRGGDLGWFTRRRWVRPFDDSAMVLKVGQVSGIVRTNYGYHLIKCTDHRPIKTFDEAKQELEALYQQRRFAEDYAAYLARLKKEMAFSRNDSVIAIFLAGVDSTKAPHDSLWARNILPPLRRSVVLSILGKPVTLDSLITIIQDRQDLNTAPLHTPQLSSAIEKVMENLLYSAKADLLLKESPEFAAVMNEYKEGVLLYQIEQDRIWSKIAPSEDSLQAYFAQHRDKFTFPDRLRVTSLRFTSEAKARGAREQLLSGTTFEQLVAEDSVRMKLPSKFSLTFSRNAMSLSRTEKAVLLQAASQVNTDSALSLRVTAFPDTGREKKKHLDLASKRIEGIKKILTGQGMIPEGKVFLTVSPLGKDSTWSARERQIRSNTFSIDILGRQPHILGTIEQSLLLLNSDDRARRADSLAVGEISAPFFFQNGYTILRLDGREPAREKTFQEAGAEVSTSFQDYESKRLEKEWIDGLRKQYPVVEQKDVLKDAFAESH